VTQHPLERVLRVVIGLSVLIATALSCGQAVAEPGASIEPSELAARIASGKAPVILDVRTADEFAAGHIPGAINVPLDKLAERLAGLKLAPTQEIVVHCQHGGRAAKAESILRESGYTNLLDLSGHMEAWSKGGYPLK
jgi:rhodanese-related sulfurtransferase